MTDWCANCLEALAIAEAVEDSLICMMSRSDIIRPMRERSEVALRMLEVLSRRLALCEARLEERAYRSHPRAA